MLLPDGNGAPESRSAAALASGSVVVKPASASAGFYYSALRPAEHFLPVRADFADLEQTLEWARAHDAEAERIAARARRFARTHLREVPVACYVIALLEAYAALQRGLLPAAELPAEPIEADPAFARVAREVQRARARAVGTRAPFARAQAAIRQLLRPAAAFRRDQVPRHPREYAGWREGAVSAVPRDVRVRASPRNRTTIWPFRGLGGVGNRGAVMAQAGP